ncbi:hypothetical protein Ccrd_011636 [Cynara cardunculus var. scolymus]|uniref:Uncharacterized protein n=1 Tax=Cynara cardunculus var. scolymus TaxID=59895 RepID=A0A103YJ02_CYNCS|nr:hypothetical protein Ccrd_011636 [Cynara cardunculus var. scolymus]
MCIALSLPMSLHTLDSSYIASCSSLILLIQCAYNFAKSKKFHLWGSSWRHGDSLLFALSCAPVMYAFVMRPESLPKPYQDFIQKTGPVAQPCIQGCQGLL